MLYPLTFDPIFKERVWGGRRLARLYGKPLPPGVPIGESWEIADRPDAQSIINAGPLAGESLSSLMRSHPLPLLGQARPSVAGRFPVLVKILDARQMLSLQVHPPAEAARRLGGEPKSELWYVAEAEAGACIYTGLARGVTRADFERSLAQGTVAQRCHRHPVQSGDAIFLPSGRLHALGGGLVIYEIQQNSDTTFRVFDWNREGKGGAARPLHLAESLASIDFQDHEPPLLAGAESAKDQTKDRPLLRHDLFDVDLWTGASGGKRTLPPRALQILAVTRGEAHVVSGAFRTVLKAGQFSLIPAELAEVELQFASETTLLHVRPG